MQLLKLYIEDYKNLNDFSWDIGVDNASPALLVMGRNASGKTNLLESIIKIFDFLYSSTKRSEFKFSIRYKIESVIIEFKVEKNSPLNGVYIDEKFINISEITRINNTFKPKSHHLDSLLPENVVMYYSGTSNRFYNIFNSIKNSYAKKYRKQRGLAMPHILNLEPFHYKLILLSLFSFDDNHPIYSEFLEKYFNIESLSSFQIHIRKHTNWVEDKEYKDFFSTKGVIRNFLEQLHTLQKETSNNYEPVKALPLKISSSTNIFHINRVEYYFDGNDALKSLKNTFGYEVDLFKILNVLFIAKNLSNISISLTKKGIETPIDFDSLSEGEQQFIAIKGMIYLLQGKDTLFLWDEPDTYLNPSWQWNLIPDIEKDDVALFQKDQFIITSHSPILLSTEKERGFFMENGSIKVLPNTYGRSVNESLSQQGLNSRSEENSEDFGQLFEFIEERNFEDAKTIFESLVEKYGKNHSDLIRANSLIKLYS